MVYSLARFPTAPMLLAVLLQQLLLLKVLLPKVSEFYGSEHNLIINIQ